MYAFGMVVYEVITGSVLMDPTPIGFGRGSWEFAERFWDENRRQCPSARAALERSERVAKTSTIVDPGPTIRKPGRGPPRLENSCRNLCEKKFSPAAGLQRSGREFWTARQWL